MSVMVSKSIDRSDYGLLLEVKERTVPPRDVVNMMVVSLGKFV